MTKQFLYFLKNFSLFHDLNPGDVFYGQGQEAPVTIIRSISEEFWNDKKDIDITEVAWKEWNNQRIPFLFAKDNSADIVTYEDNRARINYDIVASAFYFLSGWNELTEPEKDQFGRISYGNSIIKELNINNIPVVNYYFDILRETLEGVVNGNIFRKDLWQDYEFGVALTHDIDTCQAAWLEGSFSELRKKRFHTIPKLIFSRIFGKDDWFNFEEILQTEKQFDATSSYYFLPERGKVGNWKNADYRIDSKPIQQAISLLKDEGNEIGLHGSFGTHVDGKMLQSEKNRIYDREIVGNRFHFLMFDPLKTVGVLELCNIKYDSSLGFAEQIGFRRGTCYPFYLFNFEKGEISPVIEIPLLVMDVTLSNRKYMGVSEKAALEQMIRLIDETRKFSGVFTVLWHNTHFSRYKYTGWKQVYQQILEYCKDNNGLLASGEVILSKIAPAIPT